MFRNIKVGDRIWSMLYGWGTVTEVTSYNTSYPIRVVALDKKNLYHTVTLDGKSDIDFLNPTWFWDEIKIIPPKKPLPELKVDTKVLVWWNDCQGYKQKRHFSNFDDDGRIHCFRCGVTSWSSEDNDTTKWDNWEAYKEDEI